MVFTSRRSRQVSVSTQKSGINYQSTMPSLIKSMPWHQKRGSPSCPGETLSSNGLLGSPLISMTTIMTTIVLLPTTLTTSQTIYTHNSSSNHLILQAISYSITISPSEPPTLSTLTHQTHHLHHLYHFTITMMTTLISISYFSQVANISHDQQASIIQN